VWKIVGDCDASEERGEEVLTALPKIIFGAVAPDLSGERCDSTTEAVATDYNMLSPD
jgi:hypothetical protein